MIPLYGQLLFHVEEAKMTGCFLGTSKSESLNSSHLCEVPVLMGSDTSVAQLGAAL